MTSKVRRFEPDQSRQNCSTCCRRLQLAEFYWDTTKGRHRADCKLCHQQKMRVRSRAHYRANKSYYFVRNRRARRRLAREVQALKRVPCADCGAKFHTDAMEFDHARGKKLGVIGYFVSAGLTKQLWVELAKCDIVCAVCHRARTRRRRQQGAVGSIPTHPVGVAWSVVSLLP